LELNARQQLSMNYVRPKPKLSKVSKLECKQIPAEST